MSHAINGLLSRIPSYLSIMMETGIHPESQLGRGLLTLEGDGIY